MPPNNSALLQEKGLMELTEQNLQLRLAVTDRDRRAAERLRYDVFVRELGGDGDLVDHEAGLERDAFDAVADHLVLVDDSRDTEALDHVVGAYRLLTEKHVAETGRFYSEAEYDLTPLKASGQTLLELGRSCIHREYRGGLALRQLWSGLAAYVQQHDIRILFGVASFHGADITPHAAALSHLYHAHLAPAEIRVRALDEFYARMDLVAAEALNRVAAMRDVPALIKSYLRLGGFVGDGAFVDHAFNTTDVCLVMDTRRLSEAARARYAGAVLL